MFRYFRNKTRGYVVTLRFSLLSIFISLFVTMMLVLFSLFYFHMQGILLQAGLLLMEKDSHAIMHELDLQLQPVASTSEVSANNIREHIVDPKNETELMRYLMHVLKQLPLTYAVYWGGTTGDFYYARREPQGKFMMAIVNRHGATPTNTYFYLDKHHHELKRIVVPLDYDPRSRLWFQLALAKKKTIWTDAYIYSDAPLQLGITVATPVFQSKQAIGVFGIDVRLDALNNYLSGQVSNQHSEIFIVDKTGRVVVPPAFIKSVLLPIQNYELKNVRNLDKPWVEQAFDEYIKNPRTFFAFENTGKDYLASFTPIPILADNGWLLGIVDQAADFTKALHKTELMYVSLVLAVFIIGIVLILYLVTRIVTPIKKLVKETEKIKMFNLEGTEHVESRIKEVIEISDAIYSMKMGLRSFQKYVPASLVRQLIRAGEDVRIGGKKEELAIFFSDIKDFTAITEKTDSNQLMKQVCDYLDTFSHIIIMDNGTIDKFIGDAIMAFWGAPMAVKHPCEHAAHAALHCMQQLKILNEKWTKEDKPNFATRIGLHYGVAIVGNLGSSERLNYTVLGDAVNIASRLVNANKLYSTSILVSESVYDKIKNTFVLRIVDKVTLKGKAESVTIYELLAETKDQLTFDIDAYQQQYIEAFSAYQQQKWATAIKLFGNCLTIYSEDTLAPVFIHRCHEFVTHPPIKDWDGIWHSIEK
ncbi:MAG: hypothetical protein A3F11_04645 [Gammaproteobacteria bacterium RIFCSPHIGHO2_12_FULL_37_14]|nr:MAG: hypothetical protein A3F11_04645 [Gammaproteobacteria bacterium RIFCSPHIGHO2_12_FULL_37_14]